MAKRGDERAKATPEMRQRRKAYPLTDMHNQAYCVVQWLSGLSQKTIARQFGYPTSAQVNLAIAAFLREVTGRDDQADRRRAAERALGAFLEVRAEIHGTA